MINYYTFDYVIFRSLDSFLNNVKIDQDLRELIKSTFPDLFPSQNSQLM